MRRITTVFGAAILAAGLLAGAPAHAQWTLAQNARLEAADAAVKAALRAVEDAEKRLDAAREPLPGERLGTAGRKSRLSDEYFRRIEREERELQEARARLQRAYRARSDAKGN